MINVCVPVLRRYDLLHRLLVSLQQSTVVPSGVYVIDNGRQPERIEAALDGVNLSCDVIVWPATHAQPSLADAWNWFLMSVPEERVITNDDIVFAPHSLQTFLNLPRNVDLAWAGFGFSCFLMRDSCVKKIGLFDETISPGYGYYEDEDYLQRLDGRGTRPPSAVAVNVACGLLHEHSATLKAATHDELMEHHRKFKIAQSNYMRKWHISEAEMFGVRR